MKCPFSCKNKSFLEASKESKFFLKENSGQLSLDTDHAYKSSYVVLITVTLSHGLSKKCLLKEFFVMNSSYWMQ